MALLEKHKDLKIEHHAEIEKDHQWGVIGSQRKRRGMHLYGYDPDTKKVYLVPIHKEEAIDITKNSVSSHKAYVNPKHPMLWAINYSNAERKFKKYLKL